MIETFGVNPFICTSCGNEMMLWEIWYRKYGLIYNVLNKSNYKNIINEIDEFKPIIKVNEYAYFKRVILEI